MADEKRVTVKEPEAPKAGEFDITQGVTVYSTGTGPHHKKEGEEIYASKHVADKMLLNGWATEKKGGK